MRENPAGARTLARSVEEVCGQVRDFLEDYLSREVS
jgi:hypothetical protein